MLSVQLSIIKLVFKNPCVVKARFCPLDINVTKKQVKYSFCKQNTAMLIVLREN